MPNSAKIGDRFRELSEVVRKISKIKDKKVRSSDANILLDDYWTTEDTQYWYDVLRMLEMVSNSNLRNYSVDEPIDIYTDASGLYWGGVLTQNGLPLCFTSGKFSKSQLNWTILDKEAYAVIGTVKRHAYLTDNNRAAVTVYTDHKTYNIYLIQTKIY